MSDRKPFYHGSDHFIQKPEFGKGSKDADYGQGFYLTDNMDKAAVWAANNGAERAVVSSYELDLSGLNVIYLDEYGPLAWAAEIMKNRNIRIPEGMEEFAEAFVEEYSIDTSKADVIIGTRAGGDYPLMIQEFISGNINIDELEKFMKKGNLGLQYFLKSEEAFEQIKCTGKTIVSGDLSNADDMIARRETEKFVQNRTAQLAAGYSVPGITIDEALFNHYDYNTQDGFGYLSITADAKEI